jgi:hypothetical protein
VASSARGRLGLGLGAGPAVPVAGSIRNKLKIPSFKIQAELKKHGFKYDLKE